VPLIQLGKGDPQRVGLARGSLRVNGAHSLCASRGGGGPRDVPRASRVSCWPHVAEHAAAIPCSPSKPPCCPTFSSICPPWPPSPHTHVRSGRICLAASLRLPSPSCSHQAISHQAIQPPSHPPSQPRTRVAQDLLGGVGLEQLGPLVPLMHVVRVLPQHHAAQQLGPPLHQVFQPRQPATMHSGRSGQQQQGRRAWLAASTSPARAAEQAEVASAEHQRPEC
jgi:hypothetical protein